MNGNANGNCIWNLDSYFLIIWDVYCSFQIHFQTISTYCETSIQFFKTIASKPWTGHRNLSSSQECGVENKPSTASDTPPLAIKVHLDYHCWTSPTQQYRGAEVSGVCFKQHRSDQNFCRFHVYYGSIIDEDEQASSITLIYMCWKAENNEKAGFMISPGTQPRTLPE